jgi:putative sigma-54 modulation protein
MEVQIKTKNIRLTDPLQEYIQRRLQKLEKVNERVIDATLEVRAERNRTGGEQHVAQLTIATKNTILRAEETNYDLHAAIDLAIDRMTRQIRRFHDKKVFSRRRLKATARTLPDEALSLSPDGQLSTAGLDEDDEIPIENLVRRKRFKIQPMSEEEAIEQMELLGHDFFVFFNPDLAQINVLYRRRDGQYGLIQPDLV